MSRINDALKKEGGELIRQAGSGVDDAQRLELVYGAEGSEERQMTLRDHWRIMRNHARLIISTAVVVTLLVTVWTMLSPDYYEGSARVEIDLETADPLPSEPETRVAALDPAYFATQLQIIRSPMVLEQVVKALDLPHDPIYKRYVGTGGRKIRQLLRLAFLAKKDPLIEGEPEEPPLATALDPAISHEDLKRSKDLEPFVRDLQRRLTVEPVKEPSSAIKDTRLVSIVVRHPSPMLAAKLANAIADALVHSSKERRLQAGKTTNAYLTHRIDDLQSEIREAERSLGKYASKHNILSLDPTQNTAIDRLTALNRQLVEAENARKEAEAGYREALAPKAEAPSAPMSAEANAPVAATPVEVRPAVRIHSGGKSVKRMESSEIPLVRRIRAAPNGEATRITIDLEDSVQYTSNRLANPNRIFFDLQAARLTREVAHGNVHVDGGLVSAVRVGQNGADVVRVVLDVNEVKDYTASLANNPPQLLIDLYGNSTPMAIAENSGRRNAEGPVAGTAQGKANSDQMPVLTAASALAEQNAKQMADLESKLADLRQKRAQLLVGATENWPEVQEVDQQIASLENSFGQMRTHATSVVLTNLETKYRQELAHESSIRTALDLQRSVTQVQNQDAVEYRLLQQQIETQKNLLNGYLKRFGGNDVAQVAMASNIRVVDYATLPTHGEAAGPWRLVYVVLAFLVSVSLSICLALFLEYWDDTFRSSDEVKQVTRLPVLAVIPAVANRKGQRLLRDTGLQLNDKLTSPALLLNPRVSPIVVENYRRLRTAVRSMMPETCKVLLVASSLMGEGKTTTTANLGISLSQLHSPVLLIDGDMHRQQLSQVFGVGPFSGLQELLATPGELDEKKVFSVLQKHEATGVYILPAGRREHCAAELLGSTHLRSLLRILRSRFSYILIDSPAVTACVDTMILSKVADYLLLVVKGGESSREVVRHTQEALVNVGAELLGVVLNNIKVMSYSYKYDYYIASEAEPKAKSAGVGAR